jgi:hypothetical protein
MYTMAILQDISSKTVLQAGRTDEVELMNPNFIGSYDRPGEKLNIFPNPASGREITIMDVQEEVFLFSSDGRLVDRIVASDHKNSTYNISSLEDGVYILRSGNRMEKLVIIR